MGAIKVEILGNSIPESKLCEVIRTRPKSGSFSVIGPINDWIVAGLRLRGYEINENIKESDLIIITKPEIISIRPNQRVIFAPSLSSTWQDIVKFNEIFDAYNITARYDLSKPIITDEDQVTVNIPLLGTKIKYPSKFNSYEINKGRESVIIGHLENKPNTYVIIYEPNHSSFIYSTSAMLIPYNFIDENANNLEALISLLNWKYAGGEKLVKKEILTKNETGDLVFSLSETTPETAFNKVIEKLSVIGGLLIERDDVSKSATIQLPFNSLTLRINIVVTNNSLRIRISDSTREISRLILIIRALISDTIRELSERRALSEEFKKTLILLLSVQEKLITVKDMIELDWNPYSILEELRKISGELSLIPKYSSIAEEIVKTTQSLESILKKENKLPEEFKSEIYARIEEWISELKKKASSL